MRRHMPPAALAIAVLLAACSNPVALRTATARVDACDQALLAGELVRSSQSGLAIRSADQTTEVVWPFGYSASQQQSGGVVLRDETGNVVAHEGQRVEMAGGLDANGTWKACAGTIKEVSNAGG